MEEIHALIQNVIFECSDFNISLTNVELNDFVYLDHPYAPNTNTSFVGYTENGFNINGTSTDSRVAKSMAALKYWKKSEELGSVGDNLTKIKSCMFSAIPAGVRDISSLFVGKGELGYWWSTNAVNYSVLYASLRSLTFNKSLISDFPNSKSFGCSVRLVKD